ncbi:MAG: multifunctional CCA addition/repair protein [Pseudomonadales bacterium]
MTADSKLKKYLVGGAVRDQLLGMQPRELDWVVTGSTPDEMIRLGFTQVGKDFPVFLHPESKEEYALARRERKQGSGYHGFATDTQFVTLEEDLSRRDLTINAIAQDTDGTLVDPFNGRRDLEQRILRHVSPAFSEDPLRVLRVARLAAQLASFEFHIADETRDLLKAMSSSGELEKLTPERIWTETGKALKTTRPRLFFEILREIGSLEKLFPEVDALFGVAQRPTFHPEIDAGLHCLLSLDRIVELTNDPVQRFAVLCHDLGKATTPENIRPSHSGHEVRSAELTRNLCNRLKIPNKYRDLAVRVARLHLKCHQALQLSSNEIVDLLSQLGAWTQNSHVEAFGNCCMADARGRTGLETRPYPQKDFLIECEQAGASASASTLLAEGYQGEALGKQLGQLRAEAIIPVIERYKDIDELAYACPPKKY